ncbi:MAG: GNAT family N-acetyltransferase [Solirubrobacteraceae bacterium]
MPSVHPLAIAPAAEADLDELLVLMRAYCDFYSAGPSDASLLALARSMIADPRREGVQLLARESAGHAVGFASVFWSWDTTAGSRIGIMNDLFVVARARGGGVADALIAACVRCCAAHGAARLDWQTAADNVRAQAVYARAGGERGSWVSYSKAVPQDRRS